MPGEPDPTGRRTELLVLTGLSPDVEQVIGRVRAVDPGVVVLHHDLRDITRGVVHRRLRDAGSDTTTVLELAHGCASCTLREDLLPTLRALAETADRVVLHLDPALEPEQVCWALGNVLVDGTRIVDVADLRGVITTVDAGSWLADATGDETLGERGLADLPDDERTVAQVAVGQAEFADLVVYTGSADGWDLARTDAVMTRLAPAALRLRLAELDERVLLTGLPEEAPRGRPEDVHGPLLRGRPPLDADCGVQMLLFGERRPFHPERLHEAMDVLLDGVVRTRGRIWLATRPDAVLWLESAGGGLQIGHVGEWLAAQDAEAWDCVSSERRAMAALGWDARFGDRAQDLVVIAHEGDPDGIEATLRAALLTDAELAAGEDAWRALPDPFGWWHTDDPRGGPEAAVPDDAPGGAVPADHTPRGEDD
ncbi:ribosome hibernation factor-recruiting GTPase MRF [Pseudonocardia sp. H11422]|uniref:ribosome hibernation factor-recruiting GTPase MRF n=1 Tax=Pseudonocardia sp. H11422 TaxID=2835866 RepID=UPI001BDD53AA|nr:GTP-binding protein [Pseudonocardia sp. H11422]